MADDLIDGNQFTLFRPDLIERLKTGGSIDGISIGADQWYANTIATTYALIAREHGCSVDTTTICA